MQCFYSNNNFFQYANEFGKFERNRVAIHNELTLNSKLWISDCLNDSYLLQYGYMKNNAGVFMHNTILNLCLIYFQSNNDSKMVDKLFEDSDYGLEIDLYKKICYIANINNKSLLFIPNKNNIARNYLREQFFYLTKDKLFWDKLEQQLDNFSMYKHSSESQKYYDIVNNTLHSAVEYAVIGGFLDEKPTLKK